MKYKVYNDNVHPYTEMFDEKKITLQPGEFIVMEEDDAIKFKSTFKPPLLDADGNQKPEGFKMIRIVPHGDAAPEPKVELNNCTACKYKAANASDLNEHIKSAHAALEPYVDPELDKEIAAKKKKSA